MAPVSSSAYLESRGISYTTTHGIDVGTTIGIVVGIFFAIVIIMCLLSAKARSNRMRVYEEAQYHTYNNTRQQQHQQYQQQQEKNAENGLEDPPPAYPAAAHFREHAPGQTWQNQEGERVSHWHGQHYGHRHSQGAQYQPPSYNNYPGTS